MTTTTGGLALDLIASGQSNGYLVANTALNALDLATTATLAVSVASANATLTSAQVRACVLLAVSGATITGRTVTLPAVARMVGVALDSASTQSIGLKVGTTTVTVQPGEGLIVALDGTANGLRVVARAAPGSSVTAYDIGGYAAGTYGVSEILMSVPVVRAVTVPALAAGSVFKAQTAPTASTSLTLSKNGTAWGTVTFPTATTTGSISAASGVSFTAGDILAVTTAASPDLTLAGVSFTIAATRS